METIHPYRHSGKFPVHGVVITVAVAGIGGLAAGFPYDALLRPPAASHLAVLFRVCLAALYGTAFARQPHSTRFTRVTLRYSPRCDNFCTLKVTNIAIQDAPETGMTLERTRLASHVRSAS